MVCSSLVIADQTLCVAKRDRFQIFCVWSESPQGGKSREPEWKRSGGSRHVCSLESMGCSAASGGPDRQGLDFPLVGVADKRLAIGIKAHVPQSDVGHELLGSLKISFTAKNALHKFDTTLLAHLDLSL
jgi:hypothetical protein